jgi:hypothetical protein
MLCLRALTRYFRHNPRTCAERQLRGKVCQRRVDLCGTFAGFQFPGSFTSLELYIPLASGVSIGLETTNMS